MQICLHIRMNNVFNSIVNIISPVDLVNKSYYVSKINKKIRECQ